MLHPFLPPAKISERLLARLRDLFAGFGAFKFTLDPVSPCLPVEAAAAEVTPAGGRPLAAHPTATGTGRA